MIEPITGMPGVEEYVNDFYPFVKQCLVVDGEVWGLPAFAETWIGHYNDIKYHEAGFKEHEEGVPFRDWDEFVQQCLKAKKDKVCEYPVLWPAGVGTEQLPGCWFGLTPLVGSSPFYY
jgi:ABC-type glycerol-3-phosphate transport system substrate-binding protein